MSWNGSEVFLHDAAVLDVRGDYHREPHALLEKRQYRPVEALLARSRQPEQTGNFHPTAMCKTFTNAAILGFRCWAKAVFAVLSTKLDNRETNVDPRRRPASSAFPDETSSS